MGNDVDLQIVSEQLSVAEDQIIDLQEEVTKLGKALSRMLEVISHLNPDACCEIKDHLYPVGDQ